MVPMVVEQTSRGERAYDIYSRLLVASKHAEPLKIDHFSPQFSTQIVEEAHWDVNRKIHPVSKLRLMFAV